MNDILEPPRWKNGPPVCPSTNLPAFKTTEAVHEFVARHCPGSIVKRIFVCSKCEHFHFESTPRDPSGSTSGTGRSHKHHDE